MNEGFRKFFPNADPNADQKRRPDVLVKTKWPLGWRPGCPIHVPTPCQWWTLAFYEVLDPFRSYRARP